MRTTVKPEVRNNATTSVTMKLHFFGRLSSQISFETQEGTSEYDKKLEGALQMMKLE